MPITPFTVKRTMHPIQDAVFEVSADISKSSSSKAAPSSKTKNKTQSSPEASQTEIADNRIESLTVAKLKERLKALGEPVGGKKAQLIKRLRAAMQEGTKQSESSSSSETSRGFEPDARTKADTSKPIAPFNKPRGPVKPYFDDDDDGIAAAEQAFGSNQNDDGVRTNFKQPKYPPRPPPDTDP